MTDFSFDEKKRCAILVSFEHLKIHHFLNLLMFWMAEYSKVCHALLSIISMLVEAVKFAKTLSDPWPVQLNSFYLTGFLMVLDYDSKLTSIFFFLNDDFDKIKEK